MIGRIAVLLLVFFPLLSLADENVKRVERGNLVMENVPEIPQSVKDRLSRYLDVRSAHFSDWAPGGGILISTRFGNTNQLHHVARPMGARTQLTFFKEPVHIGRFDPNNADRGFLFQKDIGGNEQNQIYWLDLDEGDYRLLTDGESRNGAFVWNNAGDRFAYYSTRRNNRDHDIWIGSQDGEHDLVAETEGFWWPLDFSPDDKTLLLGHYISITEGELWLLDLESGERVQINPSDEPIGYWGAKFSAGGEGVYLASDEDTEFKTLRYLELETGEQQSVSGHIPWSVTDFDVSGDGRWLAYVTNEDAISRLHVRDLENRRDLLLDELPVGVISAVQFSPDSRHLAVELSNATTPGDVFSYDLTSGVLTRWTKSEVGGLDTDRFVQPELIHYPTFDKVDGEPRQIPAFVYRPAGVEGKVPVVVRIHGGPEGQFEPDFSSITQYLVNEMGVAVVAPNVRGSAGYGKSYLKLDNGFKREDSVGDIGALLGWIAGQPGLDEDRVVVYGGSYGGYMVLASMVHYSDRLLGGIDVVGISNFVTFLENTKDYRRDLRREEYGDERDPEMRAHLEKISPANNAEKITKPLLVIQGANDPRVPMSESEQMVQTIRDNGGTVWYLLAKDEGHGFKKQNNREVYYQTVMTFLNELLGREPAKS